MPDVLAVEGLTVRLTAHPDRSSILDDVCFTVAAGEVLGIVGESGSGKSMLALSVMGLLPPALTMSRATHRRAGRRTRGPAATRRGGRIAAATWR